MTNLSGRRTVSLYDPTYTPWGYSATGWGCAMRHAARRIASARTVAMSSLTTRAADARIRPEIIATGTSRGGSLAALTAVEVAPLPRCRSRG
jgi:hypothetical protein